MVAGRGSASVRGVNHFLACFEIRCFSSCSAYQLWGLILRRLAESVRDPCRAHITNTDSNSMLATPGTPIHGPGGFVWRIVSQISSHK